MLHILLQIVDSHPFIANKDEVKKMVEDHFDHVEHLEERDNWLNCLEAAGVDNWSGYDYAHELKREEEL